MRCDKKWLFVLILVGWQFLPQYVKQIMDKNSYNQSTPFLHVNTLQTFT